MGGSFDITPTVPFMLIPSEHDVVRRTIIISIHILLDIGLSSNVGSLVDVVDTAADVAVTVVDDMVAVVVVAVVALDSDSGLDSLSSCTALHQQFVHIQKYMFVWVNFKKVQLTS